LGANDRGVIRRAMVCDVAVDVSTSVFEGPLDLLLQLILAEKVDLYEISLARIVDAFLIELDKLQSLDLNVATEFLLIAATLVELKARRLLPVPESSDLDDDLALFEARDLLLARLLDCKTFKDVARQLSRLEQEAGRSFPRSVGPEEHFIGLTMDPLECTSPEQLKRAYLRALTPKVSLRLTLDHVAPVRASVSDAMFELIDELPRIGRIGFARLTAACTERLEVIVRFLALLEMFKQGLVDLDQTERFGDIEITWLGTDQPIDVDAVMADAYEG
jgi:segregation and condensation protein A